MPYDWFKMYSKGWLEGSIRVQLTMEERSIWADLLNLANECRERGIIRRAPGLPYTRHELASRFGVPLDILNSTIAKCCKDKNKDDDRNRMEELPDGTLIIANWERYNPTPPTKPKKAKGENPDEPVGG